MADYSIIGLMSGSSLDGVDLAWCSFEFDKDKITTWQLKRGITIPYPEVWIKRLQDAPQLSGQQLWQLHAELGHYLAKITASFIAQLPATIDLVASHGHTIFHYPEAGFSTQIGDGAMMAAHLGIAVADQFRSQDIALGGQGAPLAPLVDKLLFPQYSACLNLGGIANLSLQLPNGQYLAYDISGANQVLNALAQTLGYAYDNNGDLARSGHLIPELLTQANALSYFKTAPPKSLGNHWVREKLLPMFTNYDANVIDRLYTFCIHLAQQIAKSLQQATQQHQLNLDTNTQLMVAGGGAYNSFLCECIQNAIQPAQLYIPSADIIEYKEALLMALAGVLRLKGLPNTLSTATGAKRATCSGALHHPGK